MYHLFIEDAWGNKVPVMSCADRHAADDYLKHTRLPIAEVVEVPRNVESLIML